MSGTTNLNALLARLKNSKKPEKSKSPSLSQIEQSAFNEENNISNMLRNKKEIEDSMFKDINLDDKKFNEIGNPSFRPENVDINNSLAIQEDSINFDNHAFKMEKYSNDMVNFDVKASADFYQPNKKDYMNFEVNNEDKFNERKNEIIQTITPINKKNKEDSEFEIEEIEELTEAPKQSDKKIQNNFFKNDAKIEQNPFSSYIETNRNDQPEIQDDINKSIPSHIDMFNNLKNMQKMGQRENFNNIQQQVETKQTNKEIQDKKMQIANEYEKKRLIKNEEEEAPKNNFFSKNKFSGITDNGKFLI